MCVVSMVGDHYKDKWWPNPNAPLTPNWPNSWPPNVSPQLYPSILPPIVPDPTKTPEITMPDKNVVSKEDFDNLRRDVDEMIVLLKRAKIYDETNHEPHCENEDKIALLRMVAKAIGIDLDKEIPGLK